MPKRTDIGSILIIGAGPIVIGQACEFDYSGVQACKALRAEGYRIILVNSNPATIMTDPELADATYVEPITAAMVEQIIAKERPDALLPTMGGQTALNVSLELERLGVLEKYGVEMIGARAEVIDKAEDRQKFRDAMDKIGLESPQSQVAHTMDEALAAQGAGRPAGDIIRPSSSRWPAPAAASLTISRSSARSSSAGLDLSPTHEVLDEESVLGWKEFELEVVRDKADNWHHRLLDREHRPDGRPHRRLGHRRAGPDPYRQGVPADAHRRDRGAARGGGGDRRVQRAVRAQSGRRAHAGDRDEPAGLAQLRPRLEGYRLSDRQGRRAVGGGLHARRADERDHRRDARLVRAEHRLRGHQDPALRVRKVSGRRADADHLDEERRRGDGDRAHLRREPAKGAAGPGDRARGPRRGRDTRRRRS